MSVGPYKKAKIQKKKAKAFQLYKQGLTTREVGAIMKKSHQWVAVAVKEMQEEVKSKVTTLDN